MTCLTPSGSPKRWSSDALALPGVHPRLEQVADDLLDEERIALGLLVERVGERARRRLAGAQPHELGRVGLAEAPDVELGGEPVAL